MLGDFDRVLEFWRLKLHMCIYRLYSCLTMEFLEMIGVILLSDYD